MLLPTTPNNYHLLPQRSSLSLRETTPAISSTSRSLLRNSLPHYLQQRKIQQLETNIDTEDERCKSCKRYIPGSSFDLLIILEDNLNLKFLGGGFGWDFHHISPIISCLLPEPSDSKSSFQLATKPSKSSIPQTFPCFLQTAYKQFGAIQHLP